MELYPLPRKDIEFLKDLPTTSENPDEATDLCTFVMEAKQSGMPLKRRFYIGKRAS